MESPRPERIISARIFARRIGVSRAALAKHIRRGLINPDFESDAGSFFRPERVLEAKRAVDESPETLAPIAPAGALAAVTS
jgi:hypothetical protein